MKLCSYCGIALERDDARFCQNCGKPASPHALSPTASSTASPAEEQSEQLEDTLSMPVVKKSRKSQPALPEQIAQQPWSNRPATHAHLARLPEQESSALREQVAVQSPAHEEETSQSAQPVKTFSAPPLHTELPAQELQTEIADQHVTEASAPADPAQNTPVPADPSSLDALPSTPLLPVSEEPEGRDQEPEAGELEPEASDQGPEVGQQEPEASSAEALASNPADAVASEETQKDHTDSSGEPAVIPAVVRPIPAKFSAFPDAASRFTSPLPAVVPSDQPGSARASSFPDAIRRFTSPLPAIVQSIPIKLSELPDAMRGLTSPLPAVAQSIPAKLSAFPDTMRGLASSASASLHTRQRLPMSVLSSVLVVLVLIGVGSWLVLAQPFSVPPVTQPLLGFSDAHMGLSLLYPNGWNSKKDASDSTVQFYDSSHTAQVIMAVSNVNNNSTITAAFQKQTAQLGMSGAKSVAPPSFAGASWQAMQGTVQQNSATYTCTIFATTHANHLVIWTQLAPQGVYSQEESVIFSAMRQSLRFV